jgi:hypothetical protein
LVGSVILGNGIAVDGFGVKVSHRATAWYDAQGKKGVTGLRYIKV